MKTKPYTIDELVTEIYESNLSHIEFMDNMNGGDCDCGIHVALQVLVSYWESDGRVMRVGSNGELYMGDDND